MSKDNPVCSITGCPNSIRSMVTSTVFYYVPKELSRAIKWARVLRGQIGDTALLEALICAKHFIPDAFLPNSHKLISIAIPTIFPRKVKNQNEEPPEKRLKISNDIAASLERPKLYILEPDNICELPGACGNLEDRNSVTTTEGVFILEIKNESFAKEGFDGDNDVKILKVVDAIKNKSDSNNEQLLKAIESADTVEDASNKEIQRLKELKQQLTDKHKQLLKQDTEITHAMVAANMALKRKKKELKFFPQEQFEILRKCLSPTQICHLTGKTKTKWSLDDLAVAYTVSSMTSHDVYMYIRNELKYPLPSVSNVNRLYRNIDRKRKQGNCNEICSDEDIDNDE